MFSKNYIYAHTIKPLYCKKIHEKENYTLQDLRQMQYNKWSRAKGVYSGNFLPKEEKKARLLKQGWVYEFPKYAHTEGADKNIVYKCLRNNQYVRECHAENRFHWHWLNCFLAKGFTEHMRELKKKHLPKYLNEYGEPSTNWKDNHFYK